MNVVTLLATVLGLAATAGGAVGFFKAARSKAIIEILTGENEALTGQNRRLEKDLATAIAERDSIKRENERLIELAQGSPQLRKLTAAIEKQTKFFSKILSNKEGLK